MAVFPDANLGCGGREAKPGNKSVMRLNKGQFTARLATSPADIARAQELRHLCFLASRGLCRPGGRDEDPFDALCQHVLIEDAAGRVLSCFRLMFLPAVRIGDSYSAQFYDLSALENLACMTMELGRFCIHPAEHDPDILRLAWAAITRAVDAEGVGMMFGCTSFPGADPALHRAALAHLARHHLAPLPLAPVRKGQAVDLPDSPSDSVQALAGLPPLLRSYLTMGGWVSDHAVIDAELDTLHVFTAVEVARIPPARARALRALAT